MSNLPTRAEKKLIQAIQYARLGWPVFPCKHYGDNVKKPCTLNGFYDATTDVEQIITWWTEQPKSLIGIRTGRDAGIWVVDVDMKNGKNGVQSLKDAFGSELFTEKTLVQKTPTGGKHILFKWDENRPVKCGTDLLEGIDIRGEGGYIVVAPSGYFVDDKWSMYEWGQDTFDISEAPEWGYTLAAMHGKGSKSDGSLDLKAIVEGLSEGNRDDAMNRFAWMLAGNDINFDIALAFVHTAADKCKPPLDHETVEYQLTRAYENKSNKQTKTKEDDNIFTKIKIKAKGMK